MPHIERRRINRESNYTLKRVDQFERCSLCSIELFDIPGF